MKILLEKMGKNNCWNEQFQLFANTLHYLDLEPSDYSQYFAMGTFRFVQKAMSLGAKGFGENPHLNWTYYAPHFNWHLLNENYSVIPFLELKRKQYSIWGNHGRDCRIFIRPNEGTKSFDGQILDVSELDYFFNLYKDAKEELVIVAKPQDILGEWRFMVERNGEILGHSLYRYQGNLVSHASCPKEMLTYVEKLIPLFPWSNAFDMITMDICQLNDMSFRLLECNSASCSGLYAMEPTQIVKYIHENYNC